MMEIPDSFPMPVEPQLDRPDGKRNLEKLRDRNPAWLDLFYKDEKVSGVVSEAIEVSEVLDVEEEEGYEGEGEHC